jgi:ribulose-phosphate 3-epimerase
MSRIIPAILVRNENEFRKRVSLAALFAPMIQIDVLDGTMLPERSFGDAAAIAAMRLSLPFEAHLMTDDPELKVGDWIKAGAGRIIMHIEAKGGIGLALEKIRHADRIPGIAVNPETNMALLKDWAPFVHHFQVMGVDPGAQGRPFDPKAVDRARALKRAYPHMTVAVDGGVTDFRHLARELSAVGVDDLVIGSAIWGSNDPARAYREITADAERI